MSGILNVGTRAMLANQAVLQTTGNNIANVNTPGYSRQTAVLETVEGQFSGGGYIGKGVDVVTVQRNYSEFLTRQSTMAGAVDAGDNIRAAKLKLLGGIFEGGNTGLGASVNDMLNAFSDVASAPTDLTARTVALTRVSETAARMRASSQRLDDLQAGAGQELTQKVTAVNTLAKNIAGVNTQIARAIGTGQTPNDLLDKRDQLLRDLNQYIQTSSVAARDGSVAVFIGGSQALVLGDLVAEVKLASDDFNDPQQTKLAIVRSGQTVLMDETTLGGGEVSGLLKFQNSDLAEGRNLLGRLTLAVATSMNDQHKLGLDLDGNAGGNLFSPISFTNSVLEPRPPAKVNTGAQVGNFTLTASDVSQLAASDYEVIFSSATQGSITRKADGVISQFDFATSGTNSITLDGLTLSSDGTPAAAGDRLLLKPFSGSASNIRSEFSSPRALAVASPWAGLMGTSNGGSLQLASLQTRSQPPVPAPVVTLKFIGTNQYIRSDDANYANYSSGATPQPVAYSYTSGQAIESSLPVAYPTKDLPFSLSTTNPVGNPTFGASGLAISNPAALTGEAYTVAVTSVNLVAAQTGNATYNVQGVAPSTFFASFTSPNFDYNLPISIPITGIPGLSLNLTGDVRAGDVVSVTPTPYTEPVLANWSVTLQGTPKAGDTFTIGAQPASFRNLNSGNASAIMNMRDRAMFDGSAMTDGYASLMAQLGIRAQSANYSAEVSSSIAANLEKDRTGSAGVNLDEEASRLLQFQQAYQAAAKMMQVAQGLFDTLMQTFR